MRVVHGDLHAMMVNPNSERIGAGRMGAKVAAGSAGEGTARGAGSGRGAPRRIGASYSPPPGDVYGDGGAWGGRRCCRTAGRPDPPPPHVGGAAPGGGWMGADWANLPPKKTPTATDQLRTKMISATPKARQDGLGGRDARPRGG